MTAISEDLEEAVADAKPSVAEEVLKGAEGQREEAKAVVDAKPSAVEEASMHTEGELGEVVAQPFEDQPETPPAKSLLESAESTETASAEASPPAEEAEAVAGSADPMQQVEDDGKLSAGMERPTLSSQFARTLQALKDEGKELARLHHEAAERAAGRLPALGSLLDAEEELLEAMVELRRLSPLLLVDGQLGVGKSSLINALLLSTASEDQPCAATSSAGNGTVEARHHHATLIPPIPVGRPGGRGRKLLLVRSLAPGVEGGCRYLEGRPSLAEGSKAEASMCVLSQDEWAERFLGESVTSTGTSADDATTDAAARAEGNCHLPLVLEDHRACIAWGSGLWLAEVDVQDGTASESQWVAGCNDAVCMVRAAGEGALSASDEARVHEHLEAGRQLLLIVNHCDVELEPPIPLPGEVEGLISNAVGSDSISGVHAVSLLRSSCSCSESEHMMAEANIETAASPRDPPAQRWSTAWKRCRQGIREFAAGAEQRRLVQARSCLARGRESFVHWCTQGAKVVTAATKGFQQDAENVRLARDIINRNIDAEYLAHVFSSVLVGKFDEMCAALAKAPAPDLGSAWGRHATRRAMEEYLQKELERQLRLAMQESLLEVTAEMARQEQPAFEEIRRIARRGASVPWEAEVKKLELDLQPDQLQHFAMHFFGSVAVGVLSGLGAAALEMLLAELVLGPVGLVAGVATFVAFGVQTADWPSVREAFLKQVRSRHVELVGKAREQLNFPGLCERRRRRILEQMDIILQRLLAEVAALSESASEFARCALVLQTQRLKLASTTGV